MNTFDPKLDKIAVVVKSFTLKRKSEFFLDRFSEPYIVSMAIDEQSAQETSIDFNVLPFPNVRKGDTISFDGQGHLIYGSKNPGQFLAYSILFMESDQDVKDFGNFMESVLKSEALNLGAKALLKAAPTYSTAINILQNLGDLIAKQLQKNKDDELFRRNGTLLRDVKPAYDILRTFESENNFIKTKTSIIPLDVSNKMGSQTRAIKL